MERVEEFVSFFMFKPQRFLIAIELKSEKHFLLMIGFLPSLFSVMILDCCYRSLLLEIHRVFPSSLLLQRVTFLP